MSKLVPVLSCRSRNRNGRSALKTGALDRLSNTMAARTKHFPLALHGSLCPFQLCSGCVSPVAAAAFVPSSLTSIRTSWKASDRYRPSSTAETKTTSCQRICVIFFFFLMEFVKPPDIPVKSAVVGSKASLMPMLGSTDLRLNLLCILNLQVPHNHPLTPIKWKNHLYVCANLHLGKKMSILVRRRPTFQEASWRAVSCDSREDRGVFLSLCRTTCRLREWPRYGSSRTT